MNSKDDMMVKQHASGCIHILDFLYNIQDTMHQGKGKASFIYIQSSYRYIFTDIKLTVTNMIKIRSLTCSPLLVCRGVSYATTYEQRRASKRFNFNKIDNYDVRFIEIQKCS